MVTASLLLLSFASVAFAAPALVWKDEPVVTTAHYSEDVSFDKVMDAAFTSDGLKVVFLLGRKDNGDEALTSWATSGLLPGVSSDSEHAFCVHHHVSNVQNAQSITALANRAAKGKALQVSLNEFSSKLEYLVEPHHEAMEVDSNGMVSKAVHSMNKRSRALREAEILIVDIPARVGPSIVDGAVTHAIESKAVGSVILSSVRSVAEVKHERNMLVHRRRVLMEKEGIKILAARRGRRLDDAQEDGDDEISGTYYVSMTPNIFAGLLFFLLFAVTTLIGISCMNMISGQDTYVSKMPPIGRES